MNEMRSLRVTRSILIITLLILMSTSAFFAIAEEDETIQCDMCHTNTDVLSLTSNATGTVDAVLGVPFTLVVNATGYNKGDGGFTVSIYSTWSDNDQFTFTEGYTSDNEDGDLNPQMRAITAEYTFTPLSFGDFTITIWTAGKFILSKRLDVDVSVGVDDSVAPLIDSPSDLSFVEGDPTASITWTPTDSYPISFEILDNETVLESGDWDGSQITIGLDTLPLGLHVITLTVYDLGGNSVSDEVYVTVTSDSDPTSPTQPDLEPISGDAMIQWGVVGASWIAGIAIFVIAYEIIMRRGK